MSQLVENSNLTESQGYGVEDVFVFPASFAQQRLWFLDQYEPNSPFYNIPSAIRFRGRLDLAALERTLNEIIRRHEILRTTFASKDGRPVQVIKPAMHLALEVEDLRQIPPEKREAEAKRKARDEAQRPFDLTKGPLFRARVIRLAPEDHLVLMTMHHIISDGWSIGVLVNEITTLYAAFSAGKPSPLPELPIQYADFAHWQQQWLQGEVLERQLDYWRQQLGDDPPPLELPTDRPRPAFQTYNGASHSIRIDQGVATALKAFSLQEGVTLFMTLLAALQTLLYRYTSQEDICVGTPIANRNRAEIEGLIGFFVNTLVLRTDLSGEPGFRQLLKRVREITLGAFAHQDLPFETVVEALQPERDMSRSTYFQVMLILQNAPVKAQALPDLDISALELETGTSTFDLTFSITEMGDGMDISVEYNTDLFNSGTISRMLLHFKTLIKSILANPDQKISQLELLTPEEKHKILEQWNHTTKIYPQAKQCIQQLFETQVEQSPRAEALVWPLGNNRAGQRLSYSELNSRANRLAHRLRRMGIGPDDVVAVCVERSLEMVIAVMGVWKAGGAFLPLDPQTPPERLKHILTDARVRILLTQAPLVPKFTFAPFEMLYLDTDWPEIAQEPDTNLPVITKPGNLAYMIYTSGSTGLPKGVDIQHRSLVNAYLAWEDIYCLRQIQPGRGAGTHLQMANFAFDVFIGDLVRALCSGGTLVLCPHEYKLEPRNLYNLMLQEKVDCAEFVPAVLRGLAGYVQELGADLSFMRLLVCGSDAWHVSEFNSFLRLCGPQTRLINSFGLTEATIDSSYFESRQLDLPPDRNVPIGRPFPNMRLYILDRSLQPLPVGVPGELFVGGVGVAAGYCNRPDLNEEKFIPNPFAADPQERLYRTGDMARYLPDGNIEFLGRKDFQIKIRGFRIEAGEIESVLKQHAGVQDAAVIAATPPTKANASSAAAKRLVAYLVSSAKIERIPMQTNCIVRIDANGGEPLQRAGEIELSTLDVSSQGLCLDNAPEEWRTGADLQLSLRLPSISNDHKLEGKVTWKQGSRVGIRFKDIPERTCELLYGLKAMLDSKDSVFEIHEDLAPRLVMRTACMVELADQQGEFIAVNLSPFGVCLLSDEMNLLPGETLKVGIQLPDLADPLWLPGVVQWRGGQRVGIQFTTSVRQRDDLMQVLEHTYRARTFTIPQVRMHLKNHVADYMIPSHFVILNALPLTVNGKVDRRSLPLPSTSFMDGAESYVPPRTPVEKQLVDIWSQVLDTPQVSVRSNFFELGGHSLLATQLVSRMRETFKLDIPLRTIFESATVERQAEFIEISLRSDFRIDYQPIPLVSRSGDLPLSYAQQRLWFLDQLEPGSPNYNLPEATRLLGPLDVDALERSLNAIVERHENLRTTFTTVDGTPHLVIAPQLFIPISLDDLSHLPAEEREQQALKIARVEAATSFDLAKGPLLRARLLKLDDDEHIILLTMHHIIGDEWSTNILVQEIAVLYDAFIHDRPSPLPPLQTQYADFAAWQREWLQGEVLEAQLSYWKEQLQGCPPRLELPTDRPRPAMQTYNGAYQTFRLSKRLSQAIKKLCQAEGATTFMTLLAAFQVLLSRYAGEDDICVGTPIANRNREDIEPLIGFFVNTLVMRSDLSGEPTFRELLKQVREVALGAYAHQDLPFEMLVDALQPDRNLSHSPLFQVMFTIQNAPPAAQELPGLNLSPFEVHSGTAKFDLTLFMLEEFEQLGGAFEYNTDLYDAATITHMIAHFESLLESIVADPDQSIARLELLTEEERRQLLVDWNATQAVTPAGVCAHQLIEDQVEKTPQAIAVAYLDESGQRLGTLTYDQLNRRANQLAHYLQEHGLRPDDLVCVCMERKPELMVALLGVLKAGGAYVPVDPSYPPGRLAYLLKDSARASSSSQPLVLTQEKLAGKLTGILNGGELLCLDADLPQLDIQPQSNPHSDVSPADLAYVIYTSGSTGKPKGVMIPHRGLVNYLSWCQRAYPLQTGRGSLVHSSISFDLTITSLFTPLISGKEVLLLPDEQGAEALGNALRNEDNFSLIKITPAHLMLLGELTNPAEAASKTAAFIIGGENLLSEHIAFWQTFAPATALVNEYGPTETVVGCCVYWAPPGKHTSGVVPIGRPIINTQHYILDNHLQPVPIGVPGELYIGGAGVGRGYLNMPEETARRFVPDPFSSDPSARLYKTGDLVRYRPDGNIECLGRIDFQVKIRGFRVELGEIESVLGQHPAVSQVFVWVHESGVSQQLVAYIVPENLASPPDAIELQEYLREQVPEYMLPAAYVNLEALPLTKHGKIDRAALPAPIFQKMEEAASFEPPRTHAEQTLAGIWARLLGLEEKGGPSDLNIHANFFELGGDSILAIQVIARANQAGLQLTPRQLFEFPTIAELAAVAGTAAPIDAEQGQVTGDVQLIPIQRWFLEQDIADRHHWNQSMLVEVPERLERATLEVAMQHILAHHDALRMRFERTEAGWRQVCLPPQEQFHLVWLDISTLSPAEQTQRIEGTAAKLQASLNLTDGPMLQVAYFELGAGRPGRLLIVVHHLVIDAVSWTILLEDFQRAYTQIKSGTQPLMPQKTTSFKQWGEKLVEYAVSTNLQAELDYWLAFAGWKSPGLPRDNSRGENSEGSTDVLSVDLSLDETTALVEVLPRIQRVSVEEILLYALAQALRKWMGDDHVMFNLEGHGRQPLFDEVDLSRTIGWFTSIHPVYLDLSGTSSPEQALQTVKTQHQKVPGHGMGYGVLRYLHPDGAVRKKLQRLPQPEVSFNYFGQAGQVLDQTQGLSMAPEDRGAERAPFAQRTHLLEIDGGIAGGRLHLEWTYSQNIHSRETISRCAAWFTQSLRHLIAGSEAATEEFLHPMKDEMETFGWNEQDIEDIFDEMERFFEDLE